MEIRILCTSEFPQKRYQIFSCIRHLAQGIYPRGGVLYMQHVEGWIRVLFKICIIDRKVINVILESRPRIWNWKCICHLTKCSMFRSFMWYGRDIETPFQLQSLKTISYSAKLVNPIVGIVQWKSTSLASISSRSWLIHRRSYYCSENSKSVGGPALMEIFQPWRAKSSITTLEIKDEKQQ